MKFTSRILLLLALNALPSAAQSRASGPLRYPFETMKAIANIDTSIAMYNAGDIDSSQPVCKDKKYNYINIVEVSENVDEATFLASPFLSSGTELAFLKGSTDYDYGKDLVEGVSGAVDFEDCEGDGVLGVAHYGWLSSNQTPFDASVIVRKFKGTDGDLLISASAPINEPIASDDDGNVQADLNDSFEMMRASSQLDKAIDQFKQGTSQPSCVHPTKNYIFCISAPEDIDNATFLVHPVAPSGLKVGDLQGTSDYELAKGFVQGVIDAVTVDDCDLTGNYGLASFGWLSSDDYTTSVTVTSLVKDFTDPDTQERVICGSQPLVEVGEDDDEIEATSIMIDPLILMKAAENLDNAIDQFEEGVDQPECGHPTQDYLFCVNAAEDINDVTFHEHPVVPEGVKLGDLVGTPDYDLAAGLIEAALESVTVEDCDATGNYGLASFPWLDSQDQTNPVLATILVKDFTHRETGERYLCGTHPIVEIDL